MKSALRHLAWTLPVLALLAGCNGGERQARAPRCRHLCPGHLERLAGRQR